MIWLILIIILSIIAIIGIIFSILTHHDRYYFWKFPKLKPDRNGTRKPGQKPEQIFGAQPPTATGNRIEALQKIQNDRDNDFSTPITLEVDQEHSEFTVKFADVVLSHGGIRINSRGMKYSSRNVDIDPKDELKFKPLKIKTYVVQPGTDHLGQYDAHLISWYSMDKDVLILNTIRVYKEPKCIMFRIEFASGLQRTQTKRYDDPCIEFPVFENDSNRSLVFTYDQVNFAEPRAKFVKTSAPLLFYNEDLFTFILSPTMNFLTAWNTPSGEKTISMGLEGNIKELPENFWHEVVLYADRGIGRTFEKWGDIMLRYYQKARQSSYADMILSYIGYWTDNGAFYYFNHKPFANYEECLLAVKEQAQKKNVPYRYMQLDSWFYPKDDGTLIWEADPKYFPNRLNGFTDRLQLPLILHNRWFSQHTQYKITYKDFITEEHPKTIFQTWDPHNKTKKSKKMSAWSLPTKIDAWNDIMATAQSCGCVCYEQDWLQPQWRFFDYLRENVYNGRIWLKNMAEAAYEHGMTVQYCMAFPSFFLESLEFPNVTHARCSDDYLCTKPKRLFYPHFTQTSMLCWAIGIWPWKDPFYSTCFPKEGTVSIWQQKQKHYEQWPELECLYQVLSGGPVGNCDEVDKINASLLLQTCREDGLLLKPDRPLFPIDLMFLDHNKPYTCATYSIIQGAKWWYLLQTQVWTNGVTEFFITLEDLGLAGKYVMYDYFEKKILAIDAQDYIGKQAPMKENDYFYCVLAPILSNGMAFIGLRDKIATTSSQVITKVMIQGKALCVEGMYTPHQEIALIFYVPEKPTKVLVNKLETKNYTWGPHFKTLSLVIMTEENFSVEIE